MIRAQIHRFGEMSLRQKAGIVLGVTIALALAIGLIILSAAIAIVLLPIVVVAGLFARWRLRKAFAEAEARANEERGTQQRIIDADFEVVEDRDRR